MVLNEALGRLTIKEQNKIIGRLVSSKDETYYEAIAEIVYILLWQHLSWDFDKDPLINKKSPDFRVISDKTSCSSFLCDVTVVRHNHPHETKVIETTKDFHTPLPLVTVPIEQLQRFLMKIREKFEKYKEISISRNCPLVIAFFIQDFENAFFLIGFS